MNNLLVLHLFPLSVLYRGEKKILPLYTRHAEEKEREGREGWGKCWRKRKRLKIIKKKENKESGEDGYMVKMRQRKRKLVIHEKAKGNQTQKILQCLKKEEGHCKTTQNQETGINLWEIKEEDIMIQC